MEPISVFQNAVVTFVLTTIIFIFLENKDSLHFPTLEEQLKKESKTSSNYFFSYFVGVSDFNDNFKE